MSKKICLVTGANSGIGKEIALEFAREGANVAFHYSRSANGAKAAVREARQLGSKAGIFKADFNNLDDVLNLAKWAIDFLENIDILVNNAGITFNKPFLKVTPEQFIKLYNVNIRAQFFLTQRVVKNMLEHRGGVICNISSIHGLQGAPEHAVYAGTKGAIIAYTRALAVELAHKGVRVNAIAPGWVTVESYYKDIPGFNEEQAKEDANH